MSTPKGHWLQNLLTFVIFSVFALTNSTRGTLIVVGNGIGNPSSNPSGDCLRFTFTSLSLLQQRVNSREDIDYVALVRQPV